MGVVAPGFSWSHFTANGWAGAESFSGLALPGMFAAIPFAIWFFLAIEGASMAAEEAKDPQHHSPRAGRRHPDPDRAGDWRDDFAGGVGDWRPWPILTTRCRRR
jgi:ethanolamine permease